MAENHFYWIVVYGWSDLENPEITSRLFLAFVGKNSMHRKGKWSECHKMIYSKDSWWVPVCHALVEKWHFRIFFLKLNLESLTIYYDLQLCEGFCCIELVLTEICTLSANVMTISAMWMFSVSAFQLIAMHSFIVVVFWSFIRVVKESIFRVSDNGHLGSAWRHRVLRPWHQASCAANVNT